MWMPFFYMTDVVNIAISSHYLK